MNKIIIYITFLSLFMAGCSSEHTRIPALVQIDSLQRINSDSAFQKIYEMRNGDCQQDAYYKLMETETFLQKDLKITDNDHTTDLIGYFKHVNDRELLSRAYLCRSINRYKNHRYTESLYDALEANKYLSHHDLYQNCMTQLTFARIYETNKCYQLALNHITAACNMADGYKKNPNIIAQCYNLKASIYREMGKKDSVIYCIRHIIPILHKINRWSAAETFANMGEWYMMKGDMRQALYYVKKANTYDYTYHNNLLLGHLYKTMMLPSLAEMYWYDAATSGNIEAKIAAFDSLTSLKPNDVFLYQHYKLAVRDAMTTNGEELANLQAKAQQTETNELMYQRTITLLCIILVMMIFFFVSYLYYRKRILNYRRHLKNVNARYLEDIEAYNQAKKDIGQLEKRIAEYQEDKEMPEKWNMQNMLGTTEVMCMHRIAAKGQIPAESNWQELQQLIMDRDKAMATALGRHQELNAKEIQICMLIRFRFLPSEISTLLDISAQNVTNMRQRLMLKMFQQKGGARDFDQMIRSL